METANLLISFLLGIAIGAVTMWLWNREKLHWLEKAESKLRQTFESLPSQS